MTALDHAGMFTQKFTFGCNDQPIRINPQADRAQFRDMYNALATRREGEQKLLPQAREWATENSRLLPVGRLLEALVKQ